MKALIHEVQTNPFSWCINFPRVVFEVYWFDLWGAYRLAQKHNNIITQPCQCLRPGYENFTLIDED